MRIVDKKALKINNSNKSPTVINWAKREIKRSSSWLYKRTIIKDNRFIK